MLQSVPLSAARISYGRHVLPRFPVPFGTGPFDGRGGVLSGGSLTRLLRIAACCSFAGGHFGLLNSCSFFLSADIIQLDFQLLQGRAVWGPVPPLIAGHIRCVAKRAQAADSGGWLFPMADRV